MVSYMYSTDMEKLTDQKSRKILLLILQSMGYKLGAFTSHSLFFKQAYKDYFRLISSVCIFYEASNDTILIRVVEMLVFKCDKCVLIGD